MKASEDYFNLQEWVDGIKGVNSAAHTARVQTGADHGAADPAFLVIDQTMRATAQHIRFDNDPPRDA